MPNRPVAFVLASTDVGSIIVSRFDYMRRGADDVIGVGFQLLTTSSYESGERAMVAQLLHARRRHFGDGVTLLDVGANIGAHTIVWAKEMTGWGKVVAYEPQERLYYALCGNIALNNCFNASASMFAIGERRGLKRIPKLDHLSPASFGSLELCQAPTNERIGQNVSYSAVDSDIVESWTIDTLNLRRIDLIKIDVEGMEAEVLRGARSSIMQHRPVLLVEGIKDPENHIRPLLAGLGYSTIYPVGANYLAVHPSDPTAQHIRPETVQQPAHTSS